jgi:AcrR family transcriptional regulator
MTTSPLRAIPASDPEIAPRGVERALASQRRKYEDEVERLVDATFRVMRARDTAEPTVSEILAEAKLSTSSFYRHFPGKDDLFLTLLERAHSMTRRHIEEKVGSSRDPIDQIEQWVRAMFDLLRTEDLVTANRPFLLAHPRLLERFPDEINSGFDALVKPLALSIGEARHQAGLPPGDATLDGRLVLHQIFGMLVDAAALHAPPSPAVIDGVVSYTLRAVLAAEPARRPGPNGS